MDIDGNDFTNNLFSDLSPLLSLFGEQVTKQFMSMSMGWADDILLAMGPLGILTIIVSAIRVGGVRRLKALVGRAREENPTAEIELLSSTSADVCELWTGQEIVRVRGQPKMSNPFIITADGTVSKIARYPTEQFFNLFDERSYQEWRFSRNKLASAAPNLALNLSSSPASASEIWAWAVIGCLLQLTSLVFSGLVAYLWNWADNEDPMSTYGYPCYLIGTVLCCAGVAVCGHVVESVSKEVMFRSDPKMRNKICIVRIQSSCTVSDQHFGSYALFNPPENPHIRFSYLVGPRRATSCLAVTGTWLALLGFFGQFIGLRGLHWSAAIVQLGVTLILTVARAIVRRDLSSKPLAITLKAGDEAASLVPIIDTIKGLLTLGGVEENSDTLAVNAGWAEALKRWEDRSSLGHRDRQHGSRLSVPLFRSLRSGPRSLHGNRDPPIVTPHDVIITGAYAIAPSPRVFIPSEIHQRSPRSSRINIALRQKLSAHAKGVLDVCTLYAIDKVLQLPDQRLSDIILADRKVLQGLKGVADYLALGNTVLQKSRYAFEKTLFWEIDGPVWELQPGHPTRPDSISPTEPPLGVRPIAVRLDLFEEHCPKAMEDLEAILDTWTHERQLEGHGSNRSKQQHVRIVSSARSQLPGVLDREPISTLAEWLGLKVMEVGAKQGGPARRFDHATVCFGLYLSPIARKPSPHGSSPNAQLDTNSDDETDISVAIVELGKQRLLDRCAKELFSLFILAIAENVEEIKGTTTRRADPLEGVADPAYPRVWENTVFEDLVNIAVEAGIAESKDEARALIIPAFAWYGLLPTEESLATETVSGAEGSHVAGDIQTPSGEEQQESQHNKEVEHEN